MTSELLQLRETGMEFQYVLLRSPRQLGRFLVFNSEIGHDLSKAELVERNDPREQQGGVHRSVCIRKNAAYPLSLMLPPVSKRKYDSKIS